MTKLFDCVGTSRMPSGEVKYRVANGREARTKHLIKVSKHTDVMLFDTPRPMTKEDAIEWYKATYESGNPDQMDLNFDGAEEQPEAQPEDRMAEFDAEMAAMGDVYGSDGDGDVADVDELPEDIDPELLAEIDRRESEDAE